MEDRLCIYHSKTWEEMTIPIYMGIHNGTWAWITWDVDEFNVATMKWSRL